MLLLLGKPEKKGDRLVYAGSIDLAGANLEVGRYYELHAWVPPAGSSALTAMPRCWISPGPGCTGCP